MDNKQQTPEQIEYEQALKNIHKLSMLKSVSEEGIDTSRMSEHQINQIERIIDKRVQANNRAHERIIKIQQDMQIEMTKIDIELKAIIDTIKYDQSAEMWIIDRIGNAQDYNRHYKARSKCRNVDNR